MMGVFKIEVYHVHLPKGGGYSTRYLLSSYGQKFERVMLNGRCLYNVPKNLDPFCGVVPLIFGFRLANGESLPRPVVYRKRKLRVFRILWDKRAEKRAR